MTARFLRYVFLNGALLSASLCAMAFAQEAEEAAPEPAVPAAVTRRPVPPTPEVAEAQKILKQVYAAEYDSAATSNLAKSAFSGKLILQAAENRDEPATLYVILREARDIALSAGDIDHALEATQAMSRAFLIEEFDERLTALATAAKNDQSPTDALLNAYIDTAEMALAKVDLPQTNKILSQADTLTRRPRKTAASPDTIKRVKELREAVAGFSSLPAMMKKLESDPTNEPANTIVGRFACFLQNDWPRGLALLAKGNDAALKSLAQKELAAPSALDDKMALADEWWKCSDKLTGRLQRVAREHSASLYKQCVDELVGVRKALIEQRIASVEPAKPARQPADQQGEQAAEANADPRFAEVVRRMPKEMRPTYTPNPGGGYVVNTQAARNWLNTNLVGEVFDVTGNVLFVLSPSREDTGRMACRVEVEVPSGKVDDINVRGRILFHVNVDANGQAPLKVGDRVRARGKATNLSNVTSNMRGKLYSYTILVQVVNPEWVVIK